MLGMTEVVRPYRGVSAETRRARRRAQLLEACLDVVGAVGVADTTAEAVCGRAGLSKRYFYESFADREAVLVATLDTVFEAIQRAIAEQLADAPRSVNGRVTRTVTALVETLSADQRAARLYMEAGHHPTLEQRRGEAFDLFALLMIHEVLRLDDPDDPAARATALLIVSGTTEVLARWLSGDLAMRQDEIVRLIATIGRSAAAALRASRRGS
jgi:AcrR family transcriptional regulator